MNSELVFPITMMFERFCCTKHWSRGRQLGSVTVAWYSAQFALNGIVTCWFGLIKSVNAEVISPTVVKCAAPAHPSTVVRLKLSINGVDMARDSVPFRFQPQAVAASIQPTVAPSKSSRPSWSAGRTLPTLHV